VTLIKPGASILEVNKKIEAEIIRLGGLPAFPVQISLNHIAAHYCPDPDDTTPFKQGDVCKLDLGVHIDGYIADTAITVDLGTHDELVAASKEACEAALKLVAPGVEIRELGRAIQEVITAAGFSPVRNLCGHGLNRYGLHEPPTIPNYDNKDTHTLKEGMVIAIEPFATTGKGLIQEQHVANIYSHIKKKPVRSVYARQVQDELARFNGLPFTTHWLRTPQKVAEMALRELDAAGALLAHPPLVEVAKGLVSQHEHSVIVGKKPRVFTKDTKD
jgi:methionyl aminopeptidase